MDWLKVSWRSLQGESAALWLLTAVSQLDPAIAMGTVHQRSVSSMKPKDPSESAQSHGSDSAFHPPFAKADVSSSVYGRSLDAPWGDLEEEEVWWIDSMTDLHHWYREIQEKAFLRGWTESGWQKMTEKKGGDRPGERGSHASHGHGGTGVTAGAAGGGGSGGVSFGLPHTVQRIRPTYATSTAASVRESLVRRLQAAGRMHTLPDFLGDDSLPNTYSPIVASNSGPQSGPVAEEEEEEVQPYDVEAKISERGAAEVSGDATLSGEQPSFGNRSRITSANSMEPDAGMGTSSPMSATRRLSTPVIATPTLPSRFLSKSGISSAPGSRHDLLAAEEVDSAGVALLRHAVAFQTYLRRREAKRCRRLQMQVSGGALFSPLSLHSMYHL